MNYLHITDELYKAINIRIDEIIQSCHKNGVSKQNTMDLIQTDYLIEILYCCISNIKKNQATVVARID